MMTSKKGLSAVVTTLIIILLSLVAIGIIWVVVSNVLKGGAETTEIMEMCLHVDIKATAASCTTAGVCNVTYRRNAGGDNINGIIVVLSNGVSSNQTQIAGNVAPFDTKTLTNFATGLTSPVPNTAEIAAYFIDASGKQQTCSTTGEFEF